MTAFETEAEAKEYAEHEYTYLFNTYAKGLNGKILLKNTEENGHYYVETFDYNFNTVREHFLDIKKVEIKSL